MCVHQTALLVCEILASAARRTHTVEEPVPSPGAPFRRTMMLGYATANVLLALTELALCAILLVRQATLTGLVYGVSTRSPNETRFLEQSSVEFLAGLSW